MVRACRSGPAGASTDGRFGGPAAGTPVCIERAGAFPWGATTMRCHIAVPRSVGHQASRHLAWSSGRSIWTERPVDNILLLSITSRLCFYILPDQNQFLVIAFSAF